MLRSFVAAAIAAIVGGLVIAQCMGKPEATPSELADSLGRTTNSGERTRSPETTTGGPDRARSVIQPGGGFVSPEVLERLGDPAAAPTGPGPNRSADRDRP